MPRIALVILFPAAICVCSSAASHEDGMKKSTWIETTNIKWCSGGGDWKVGADPFGVKPKPGSCPVVPANWTVAQSVAACEKLCEPAVECLGFTWYPSAALAPSGAKPSAAFSQCCFRTGSVASKPPCGGDPSCAGTRCYEKPMPAGGPNISALFPARVPIGASSALIGVAAQPGESFLPTAVCRFSAGDTISIVNSSFVNSSFVRCALPSLGYTTSAPAVAVANVLDPGVQGGAAIGNSLDLDLVTLVTVSVGRRPYVNETMGHILFKATGPLPTSSEHAADDHNCSVVARLNKTGVTLTNTSWAVDLSSEAVISYPFSLSGLPATVQDAVKFTITCPGLGFTLNRYRDFQRFKTSEDEVPSTVSQVDHLRRSILVNGEPWVAAGWYYSLSDNAETNLTEFLANQARMGMNTMMLYTFPLQMFHGEKWAAMQKRALDAADATGMKILMDIEQVTMPNVANTTVYWSEFQKAILAVKDHPATLGYYICDDCCRFAGDNTVQSQVYRAIKALDPYHVTAGAVNGACASAFTDGEGPGGSLTLSLDVPLNENYNPDLHARTGPGVSENTANNWPMHWTPVINCPYYEASNQLGLSETDYKPGYSPYRARSTCYAGLVGNASMPNLILFDYFSETEDLLLQGAELVAREFDDLKPSLVAPLDSTQPTTTSSNSAIFARSYAEDVVGAQEVCIHTIALNVDNSFQAVDLQLGFPGLPDNITAFLPFEDAQDRPVPVVHGTLKDFISPHGVNVYRIGCKVPCMGTARNIPWSSGCTALQKKNLSPNHDFEMISLLGGVTAWSGGRAGYWGADGHDLRARMKKDTTRPQHGRYSLRVTVPAADPLTIMWAQACIDSYYPAVHPQAECNAGSDGTFLPANTRYTIQLWARSDSPAGMAVEVLTGAWVVDAAASAAFHTVGKYARNETVAKAAVTDTWQLIRGALPARPTGRFLQLQLTNGPGNVYIDNTFIGANMTEDEELELAQMS